MATQTLAVKDANNTSQGLVVLHDASLNNRYSMSLDEAGAAVYRAAANFTPQPTAAVTLLSIQGSATKTVRVRRILIGGVSTANAQSIFALQRTSALGAGGTTVNPTIAKLDTNSATATAVVAHYTTSLKAAGTGVGGPINTFQNFTNVVTTPTVSPIQVMAFPELGAPVGQAIVLRGTADFLELQNVTPTNLSAATVLFYMVEWVEDDS